MILPEQCRLGHSRRRLIDDCLARTGLTLEPGSGSALLPSYGRAMAVFLNGDAITEPDPRGRRIVDDSFLLVNTGSEQTSFDLPGPP